MRKFHKSTRIVCSSCGISNKKGATECSKCGSELPTMEKAMREAVAEHDARVLASVEQETLVEQGVPVEYGEGYEAHTDSVGPTILNRDVPETVTDDTVTLPDSVGIVVTQSDFPGPDVVISGQPDGAISVSSADIDDFDRIIGYWEGAEADQFTPERVIRLMMLAKRGVYELSRRHGFSECESAKKLMETATNNLQSALALADRFGVKIG